MKKLTVAAAAAIVAAGISSCGGSAPKAEINNDIDSLSYAIGMAQTSGLKDYLAQGMNVDTTDMDMFIKGLIEGVKSGEDKDKAAYLAGVQIGQQITNQVIKAINYQAFGADSTKSVSKQNFLAGFITGINGENGAMTMEQARQTAEEKMRQLQAKQMEKEFGPNKKAGEEFLAKNAKAEGVKTTPSGLQYKVVKAGNGPVATDTSMVEIHYEGRTIDGKVFDTSYKRNQPAKMRADQGIEGWNEAIKMMPAGSEWEIYIPQELAYAERNLGNIKPFSTLIFKVQLISVDGKK